MQNRLEPLPHQVRPGFWDLPGLILDRRPRERDDLLAAGAMLQLREQLGGDQHLGSRAHLGHIHAGLQHLSGRVVDVEQGVIRAPLREVMIHGADDGKGATQPQLGFHQRLGLGITEMVVKQPLLDFLLLGGRESVPEGITAEFSHGGGGGLAFI